MTAVCLNNQRELVRCWHIYIADFADRLPSNGYEYVDGAYRSQTNSWIGSSSAPNDTSSKPIEAGLFYRLNYNTSLGTYHCPADRSRVTGKPNLLRTRSYSMSGSFGGNTNPVQTVFQRLSEAAAPTKLFVLLDEGQDSIDDGHFRTWPKPDDRWINMPTDRHGKAGTFSFADGHVEPWHWRWPKNFRVKQGDWKRAENLSDLADLRRLQEAIPEPPLDWQPLQ